jgi:hypothetical protein
MNIFLTKNDTFQTVKSKKTNKRFNNDTFLTNH